MPRRWDGRTWLGRVVAAALPVLLAGIMGAPPEDVRLAGLIVGLGWVPTVTLLELLRSRIPGPATTTVSLGVDLLMAGALGSALPGLTPVVVATTASSWALHAGTLPVAWRTGTGLVVFAAQVLGGAEVAHVLTVDAAAIVLGSTLVGAHEEDRRRSRAELAHAGEITEAVLAGIGEAVVVTDARGRVTSANDAVVATFGRPAVGSCHQALGLQRGSEVLDCSNGCPLLGEERAAAEEVQRMLPDGGRQMLLANVRGVTDSFGRVREVVHSFRDVSPIKRVEEARSLFLASTSHELKTPLTVIGGFAELLARDRLDEDQRRAAAETIGHRSRQIMALVERLLLASRLEAGAVRVDAIEIDTAPLVHDVASVLAEAMDREVTVEADLDVPTALGDRRAVETVLEHLIENAAKYSDPPRPISVRASQNERYVLIDTVDLGRGMTREQSERCFDAFWRAEERSTHGSGVGLYVARSFARVMGGDVQVLATRPGGGTVMRLRLLRAHAAWTAEPAPYAEVAATSIDEFLRQTGVGSG